MDASPIHQRRRKRAEREIQMSLAPRFASSARPALRIIHFSSRPAARRAEMTDGGARAPRCGRRGHVDASADVAATSAGQAPQSSTLITVSDASGTRPDGRITTVWAQV